MFPSLSTLEKENIFKRSILKIARVDEKNKDHLILSLSDVETTSDNSFTMLEFSKFSSGSNILVTNLKRIENNTPGKNDVYIAVCEKTIERFINLAKLGECDKLSIFTEDPYLQEILLKNKFKLRKTGAHIKIGIIATLSL